MRLTTPSCISIPVRVVTSCLLSSSLLAQGADVLAGHSAHGEVFNEGPRQAAFLMGGTGDVDFLVTCSEASTQAFFNQGVGQLHGFWHFEAERSFRQAAASEPGCAMLYWGMAMANVDNPDRAAGFIEEAVVRRAQASAREQMWIDMLAQFYEVTKDSAAKSVAARKKTEAGDSGAVAKRKFKKSKKARSADLVRGYEGVLHEHPDDIEAMAFLANRLWLNRRAGVQTNSHMVIELMLRRVFEKNPGHPSHHYRIHLWDREDASRALVSAQVSGQVSPAIAHQWHMSGHIFAKLHRHEDAVYQQSASARVDHAHMMRDGVMPYKIHNYGHNNEWLSRSLNHMGRPLEALSLAQNMVELPRHPKKNRVESRGSISGYGTRRLIDTCRNFHMDSELRSYLARGYLSGGENQKTEVAVVGEIGTALLLAGDLEGGRRQISRLETLHEAAVVREAAEKSARKKSEADAKAGKKKSEGKKSEGKKSEADAEAGKQKSEGKKPAGKKSDGKKSGADAKAGKQKSEGKKPAGKKPAADRASASSLKKALDALRVMEAVCEGRVEDARKGLKKSRLPKFCLAMCHSSIGEHEEARKLIDAEADKNPNRTEVMVRQVLIRWAAGDKEAAAETFTALRRAAGNADLTSPLMMKLGPVAEELGYPEDWRHPREAPKDVGERPELSTLGPFRWQPRPARSWTLPSAQGGLISLADYRGKAVLVIFYLGFGCLHCVEQLQHFHPMAAEYRKAGIEIVGVGTDSVEGMTRSLQELPQDSRIGFPLVADPKLDVFKQWRAFDDFEGAPLHGTYLVDGAGMVRWVDIGYEPFDKPEYLLRECKRLLAQGPD